MRWSLLAGVCVVTACAGGLLLVIDTSQWIYRNSPNHCWGICHFTTGDEYLHSIVLLLVHFATRLWVLYSCSNLAERQND